MPAITAVHNSATWDTNCHHTEPHRFTLAHGLQRHTHTNMCSQINKKRHIIVITLAHNAFKHLFCSVNDSIYRSSCRIDQSKDTNTFSSSDTSSYTQILPFPLCLRNLILCIVAPCPAPHPLLHRLHWGFELGDAGMPSLTRPPHFLLYSPAPHIPV